MPFIYPGLGDIRPLSGVALHVWQGLLLMVKVHSQLVLSGGGQKLSPAFRCLIELTNAPQGKAGGGARPLLDARLIRLASLVANATGIHLSKPCRFVQLFFRDYQQEVKSCGGGYWPASVLTAFLLFWIALHRLHLSSAPYPLRRSDTLPQACRNHSQVL